MRYAVVIENAGQNYSAYVRDMPGCVATAGTIEEARRRMREAIAMHIQGLRADRLPVPEPATCVNYIEITA